MSNNFDPALSKDDVLRRRTTVLQRLHVDGFLLTLIILIAFGGFFVLYSAGGENLDLLMKQMMSFGIGLVAMIIIAQLDPRIMARWTFIAYLIGVGLLFIVDITGHNAMGATRWINIPGVIRFQPSEFMKILMPATLSWYLAGHHLPPTLKHIFVSLILVGLPVSLILVQPDLGTALLVVTSGAFVLFMAGLQWRWILGAVTALIPIAVGMWFFVLHQYQKQRILTFLNPESDPLGSGWNIIQSKAAIGSGGVWGKGWLLGTQSHLDFLPESHTDFIIAVLAEEFGFIGVCILLIFYAMLIGRSLSITMHASTLFGRLFAGALSMTFFIYVFINIGMVSGLLPVVGVPLPLISYGGTSMITLMVGFGVLMSIQTHRKWIAKT